MVRVSRRIVPVGLGLLAVSWLLLPSSGASQEPQVLFSQVTVSSDEASLQLELDGGDEISATMSDGEVSLNGETVGEYAAGDALEASWRSLLSQAVTLDPGELPALLQEWTLPEDLRDSERTAAQQLHTRLIGALDASLEAGRTARGLPDAGSEARTTLEALVQRSDRLRGLATAMEDIDTDELTIRVGETFEVGEEETIEGSLLLVDGDLRLDGSVEGDVILLGGSVDLGSSSRITGALRTVDVEISGDRDGVAGGIRDVEESAAVALQNVQATIQGEAIREAVEEATADARRGSRNRSFSSPFRWLGRGIAGLFQTLITFGIMFGAGLAVLYFFPRHLEVVSQTASGARGRAFLVGLAGLVLALPFWVIGIVLLAISIIGIPLLLVWIPAFPVVLAVAIALGYIGVARNLGEWFSNRELRGFEGLDATRPAVQIGAGLVALLAAFALSNVFEMGGPIFGIFQGLLLFAAITGTMIAVCVGLGSVILSRAGRDADLASRAWRTAEADDAGATGSASG